MLSVLNVVIEVEKSTHILITEFIWDVKKANQIVKWVKRVENPFKSIFNEYKCRRHFI